MEKGVERKRANFRPLTRNEKFLLITLGFIIIFWFFFRFILEPQNKKLMALQNEKKQYYLQIMEYNRVLKSETKLEEKWKILNKERDNILSSYFPILDQAQIIYLLNDLVADNRVNISDLNFTRAEIENKGDMDIKKMEVLMPFIGNYDGILDIIKSIGNSPRKIIIDSLSIDREDSNNLAGHMNLKIYSLEGLAEVDKNIIFVDVADKDYNNKPFQAYEDYREETLDLDISENLETRASSNLDNDSNSNFTKKGTILYDFEDENYEFIPSSPMVKGNAIPSTISKSGKLSLRLEYDILALEDENRAYIDLSSNNIILKVPPESIGLWVYSYGYSPGTLGMRLNGQAGEKIDIEINQGITWIGWSYLEADLPKDFKMYPLKVDKLFYEIPFNREDFGVMLVDKLEVHYPTKEGNNLAEQDIYKFYIVESGDTLSEISSKIYGTVAYKNQIMKLNDIGPDEVLRVGRILVLKKH